jgi:hypothetical protein
MRSEFHGVAALFHVGGFDRDFCICSHIRFAKIECDAERAASDDRFPGRLELDPEKHALGLDPRVGTGFPSRQTRSVCAEIMLKQKDGAG